MSGATDNVVYFTTAGAAGAAPDLWASNGTVSGTYLVQSLPAGSTVYPLLEYDGVFLFLSTSLDESDFHATDGSAATTIDPFSVPVGPISLNQNGGSLPYAILPAATAGGLPFVVAGAALGSSALVGESDTTQSGTTLIDTITAPLGASPDTLTDFLAVGGTAYFVDAPASGQVHLDSTQGTAVQTVLSADALAALTAITDPTLGTRLLFAATTAGDTTLDILAEGGTTPTVIARLGNATVGTIVVADGTVFITETSAAGAALLAGGTGNATPSTIKTFTGAAPTEVTAAADGSARVFFVQDGGLWVANATGAMELATSFSSIGSLFTLGGVVYFAAATAATGNQLWSWGGTAAAATQLSSANAAQGGINPNDFAALNGVLYFSASDGAAGTELWTSSGTASGTQVAVNLDPGGAAELITAITPGIAAPAPVITGNVAEYLGTLGTDGITNGTADGTIPSTAGVITINVGSQQNRIPVLSITHGDTTAEVPVGTIAGGYIGLAPTAGGDFYTVEDYDGLDDVSSGPVSIGYIATTSLTPQTLQTFQPPTAGGEVSIEQTVSGTLDIFVVQQSTNETPTDAQLWVTNGTTTQEIGDLGAVETFNTAEVVADGSDWGGIVFDASFDADVARSVGGAAPTVVTAAALGLDDNQLGNASSIGILGALTFISTVVGNAAEVIVTDGTQAGTQTLLSQTTANSGEFRNFTNLGALMLFTDPSGNLYASDGTTGGTTELLAGDALLAPSYGDGHPTATIPYDGVTYLYFAATVNGQTGLYRTDGQTVQVIQPSGVSTTPSIVALNGLILYIATATSATGAAFDTIYATAPATTSGAPVENTSNYIADSYLDPLLAPAAASLAPVTLATVGQSYTLTTGTDIIQGGTADNTITAATDTLNPTDTIVAGSGGLNVLDLVGTGTFDLGAPATLSGISQVVAEGPDQDIILRPGTSLDVQLASTSVLGGTVQGADNHDVITGEGEAQGEAFYYVTVGGPDETVSDVGRVIEPTTDSAATVSFAEVLELTGGGAATLGPNDDADLEIVLDQPTQLTVEGSPSYQEALILGSAGPDNVTLLTGFWFFEPEASGATLTFENGGTAYAGGSGELYGTAAHLNNDTIDGYDFADSTGSTALIDVTDLPYSSAETVTSSGDLLTVTGGTVSASITITGLAAALQADPLGAFLTSADGDGGTLLTYQHQVFRLTTGIDTVAGTQDNTILATNDTLNNGDMINGGAGSADVLNSTLSLVGSGIFDLAAPATLTGITAIEGDSSTGAAAIAQTIFLRAGTLDPNNDFQSITLGVGTDIVFGAAGDGTEITNDYDVVREGGDTITLGDARERVSLQSSDAADVISTDPATALASVTDAAYGVALGEMEIVTGTGIVGVGDAFVGTLSLAAGLQAYLLGDSPDAIVAGGDDLIDASFSSAGFSGGSVTINPGGGGTVIASAVDSVVLQGTATQLDGVAFEGFNFGPANPDNGEQDSIVITDLSNAADLQDHLHGDVLTVTDGLAQGVTITLPGAPAGTFRAETGTLGTTLTFVAATAITPEQATFNGTGFSGTGGADTLTIAPGQLAPGQDIDGGGGINTLILSGAGSFDLALPTTLVDFQDIDVASGQTVTLRPGLTAEVDGSGATILGAGSADPIVLAGEDNGNDTLVLGSGQATVINGDYATTLVADAAMIGATIYGGKSTNTVLQVTGGGTAVMGANIYDISTVDLGLNGLDFQANATPGLMIAVTGTAGTPDTIGLGSGGDTILDTSAGGNTIISNPADAVFEFGPPTEGQVFGAADTIEDFDASGHDSILIPNDKNYFYFDQAAYSDNVLTITNGYSVGSEYYHSLAIDLPGSFVAADFFGQQLLNDGQDLGFQVTYTGPVTCFRAGTRIRARRGAVPVEALAIGDHVRLSGGGTRPIRWIGRRTIDVARHPHPDAVRPIRVAQNAFGPGLPQRDLFLSPDHAVLWEGALIPVKHLVNGVSIHPDRGARRVDYLHIELDAHDTILAEGLAVESYLEAGQRHSFANGGAISRLHADFVQRAWEAHGCVPLMVAGPKVAAARAWLSAAAP